MNNRLFVGNISWDAKDQDLNELFAPFGTVEEAHIATDKFSGKSRGFGFVTMGSAEEAQKAISELDGKDFLGRPIAVNFARPKEDRAPGAERRAA